MLGEKLVLFGVRLVVRSRRPGLVILLASPIQGVL